MTLEELKKRATASELTLIEATEAAVREEASVKARMWLVGFVRNNPPPDLRDPRSDYREWFSQMEEHMYSNTP